MSGDKLVAILKGYRAKISSIVYCQRIGTEELFEKLKNSGILTISIANHLISKRKAKDTRFRNQYLALHQPDVLEIKTFRIIRRYHENLRTFVAKTKRENRLNKKQRVLFKQQTLILVHLQEHLAELYRYLAQRFSLVEVV